MNLSKFLNRVVRMSLECLGDEPTYKNCRLRRGSESPEFPGFVGHWLERTRNGRDPFDRLIHLWVAFNAWLAEVVEPATFMENDRALINAAAKDSQLIAQFVQLMTTESDFKKNVEEFSSLWPIFNVRRLAKRRIPNWGESVESRSEYREKCFAQGIQDSDYEPRCFRHHNPADQTVSAGQPSRPFDWPHTLAAVYQVRCNLFHGGKTFNMPSDARFARLACEILWQVWGGPFQSQFHQGS